MEELDDGTDISTTTINKFCADDCGNYLLDLLKKIAVDCPGGNASNVSSCMCATFAFSIVKYSIIIV